MGYKDIKHDGEKRSVAALLYIALGISVILPVSSDDALLENDTRWSRVAAGSGRVTIVNCGRGGIGDVDCWC